MQTKTISTDTSKTIQSETPPPPLPQKIKPPQFEVLNRIATDYVWKLVRGRMLEGMRFFKNHTLLPEFEEGDVKLALLLVVIGHPDEVLSKDEARLLNRRQQQS